MEGGGIQRLKTKERLKWKSKSNVLTRLSLVFCFEKKLNESATGGAVQEEKKNKKKYVTAHLWISVFLSRIGSSLSASSIHLLSRLLWQLRLYLEH